MGNLNWRLCLLISTFFYVCYTQKIGYFKMEPGQGTCIIPGTVRELDPMFFFADLHFNATLDLHNWFYFAVYAIDKFRRNPRTRVGDVMLKRCLVKEMLAHHQDNPHVGCVHMGNDRIYVVVLVLASRAHSDKEYYGQWHSIDKGYVKSDVIPGFKITHREFEKLTINNFDVPLKPDITQLNLDKSLPMNIQYCVTKLNNHTTAVRVGQELFTTTKDCVETVANPLGLDEIQVGYEEYEGPCRSTQWRVLLLYHVAQPGVQHKVKKPGEVLEANYDAEM